VSGQTAGLSLGGSTLGRGWQSLADANRAWRLDAPASSDTDKSRFLPNGNCETSTYPVKEDGFVAQKAC